MLGVGVRGFRVVGGLGGKGCRGWGLRVGFGISGLDDTITI